MIAIDSASMYWGGSALGGDRRHDSDGDIATLAPAPCRHTGSRLLEERGRLEAGRSAEVERGRRVGGHSARDTRENANGEGRHGHDGRRGSYLAVGIPLGQQSYNIVVVGRVVDAWDA